MNSQPDWGGNDQGIDGYSAFEESFLSRLCGKFTDQDGVFPSQESSLFSTGSTSRKSGVGRDGASAFIAIHVPELSFGSAKRPSILGVMLTSNQNGLLLWLLMILPVAFASVSVR